MIKFIGPSSSVSQVSLPEESDFFVLDGSVVDIEKSSKIENNEDEFKENRSIDFKEELNIKEKVVAFDKKHLPFQTKSAGSDSGRSKSTSSYTNK